MIKKLVLLNILVFILLAQVVFASEDNLYSKSFGKKENPAIIFLHGGPGFNSYNFEFSTAEKLANEGFYVIVYDQKGNGRSKNLKNIKYTFDEYNKDLNEIYIKYQIKKASLIGHSFGGTLALKYADKNYDKVTNLILTGSPISYQKTFEAILDNCNDRYKKYMPENVKYIDIIKKMDKNSLDYSQSSFFNAINCGLYFTKNQTNEAKDIYNNLLKSKESFLLTDSSFEPVKGFYDNEHYTSLDLTKDLTNLTKKIKVFAIYGEEDGLFEKNQLNDIKNIVGDKNFILIKGASHNIFIDQQKEFINNIKVYIK